MSFNRDKQFMDSIIQNNVDIIESTRLKVVRLSNGLLVGNFSSPHDFTFDDGTVLPRVSDYDSMRLKVNFNETVVDDKIVRQGNESSYISTVSLDFTLSQEVEWEMENWIKMWKHNDVDIVLCPLPMIQALQQTSDDLRLVIVKFCKSLLDSPFRAVRMKDRIKKTASINTFCIGDTNGKSFRTLV